MNNDIYDNGQCTRAYIIYNLKKCDLPCIIVIELFFVFDLLWVFLYWLVFITCVFM